MAIGKTIKFVLGSFICGGLLLVGSCAGLLYYGYSSADKNAAPVVDQALTAIENGRFADTYHTLTTPELQKAASFDQYVAMGDMISKRLGKLNSKSLQGFHVSQHNGDSFIDVNYAANFENGSGVILAKLRKQRDKWKFVSFVVNSPVLQEGTADFDANTAEATPDETSDETLDPTSDAVLDAASE